MRVPPKVLLAGFTFLLSAVSAMALSFPVPAEGYYVGTVKITRRLASEDLSTSSTLKAQATVKADGKITMLTTAPELPADAVDVLKGFNFAVPIPDMYVGYPPNPLLTGAYGHLYVVDGAFPGFLKLGRSFFTLTYTSPAPPRDGSVLQPGPETFPEVVLNPTPMPNLTVVIPPTTAPAIAPTVTVEFTFRMVPRPAAPRR